MQRERLPGDVFEKLQATLAGGEALDPSLADAVAEAMKEWALENGATHYTHMFQPLTGSTAEKHDSFFEPAGDGKVLAGFSGKELIQGEPDASSFPTGGVRATFEARGYTAWDPTSPAFILENPNGALLCIPTAFASWTGEALDAKIPLLRSMDALSRSAIKALRLLGDEESQRVFTTVGPEQEYFLIDEQYFFERPDLITTGRTLFGAKPPKGHELDDHYFGSIPERVLAFMMESELEMRKLGIPVKTRHNEVAPAQYEIAPIFENSNVGSDHQQLLMQTLENVARRYGLVCLLHEKPFAGVNGSGKHNNWSMGTDTGTNLLEPGRHAGGQHPLPVLLHGGDPGGQQAPGPAAGLGRQHRPGPPARGQRGAAGDHLDLPRRRARKGRSRRSPPARATRTRRPPSSTSAPTVLPPLPLDGGDRNRTSPFAFTGNKFEFRALGSSMSLAFPNTVLNTIAAEAIDELADKLEEKLAAGTDDAGGGDGDRQRLLPRQQGGLLQRRQLLRGVARRGRAARAEEPADHARRAARGDRRPTPSPPSRSTACSPSASSSPATRSGSSSTRSGPTSRPRRRYSIAQTMILPAALRQLALIGEAGVSGLEGEVRELVDELVAALGELKEANAYPDELEGLELAIYARDKQLAAMDEVREAADKLEKVVADDLWPLPKYEEMLFIK